MLSSPDCQPFGSTLSWNLSLQVLNIGINQDHGWTPFLGEQSSGARDGDCGDKLLVCVLQINKHDRTRWYEYCGGAWARLHKSFLQLYSGRDSEITTIAGPCVNVLCVYNSSKISVLTFPEFYDLQEIDPKYCQLIETPVNFGNCTLILKLKLKFNGIHRQGSLQSVLIKFTICISLCDVMCGDQVTTLKFIIKMVHLLSSIHSLTLTTGVRINS